MYKPHSLRAHLTAANPDLRKNPDKMLIFADAGQVVASGTASLSFEYRYQLNIIITDYAGEADALMVPMLAWLQVHQSDLLNHPEDRKTGWRFEVDFNNHKTIDLSITVQLTERVRVARAVNGKLDITHPPEPQPTPDYAADFWTLYAGDKLLAEWHTPEA